MVTPRKASPSQSSYLVQQHLKTPLSAVRSPANAFADGSAQKSGLQPVQSKRGVANPVPGLSLESNLLSATQGCTDGVVVVTALPAEASHRAPGASCPQGVEDFLSQQEVEEAALRSCWVWHYWDLAHQLGICVEICKEREKEWAEVAMSEELFHAIVRRMVASVLPGIILQVEDTPWPEAGAGAGGRQHQPTPESNCVLPAPGEDEPGPASFKVSALDVVEVERAMRQLADLGVVAEVGSSLAYAAEVRNRAQLELFMSGNAAAGGDAATGLGSASRDILRLCQEAPDPEDPSLPLPRVASPSGHPACAADAAGPPCAPVSELERREIRFQRAWLAYVWSRAAAAGVEPQLALLRAESWASCLDEPCGFQRQWCELAAALREVQVLGVEQQLWSRRHM